MKKQIRAAALALCTLMLFATATGCGKQDDVMIMQIKDYIETPKENGYRSLHMVIRVPVYFMNKKQLVPVELQIRTLAMDLWASLEHDIKYKCLYQTETENFSEELKECSRLIYEAEEKMEIMNRTLEA